ncbi:DUF2254 family protein [Neptunicoccus sediminis]|uniref:DUF2254 family protein n=1 Tax=Neptunicoccus sediminis TaxID=1892596 RepID=UPI003CCB81C3
MHFADTLPLRDIAPDIIIETVEKLLTEISASMHGVATFAVASLVSAYASAGGRATPRAFALIIADGMSQEALSSFIGAFIFSIVGIKRSKLASSVSQDALRSSFSQLQYLLGWCSPSSAGSTTSHALVASRTR